jgi:phage shock protein PspC (stress-responsive transcriptional regulator)
VLEGALLAYAAACIVLPGSSQQYSPVMHQPAVLSSMDAFQVYFVLEGALLAYAAASIVLPGSSQQYSPVMHQLVRNVLRAG